ECDGAIWRQACVDASCAATLPGGRFGHAMSYDAARARAVLFGGTSCATASCGDLGDTWEWDGSRWRQASTLGPARAGHGMTYDEARAMTVLFGGVHSALLTDAWVWDGSTW